MISYMPFTVLEERHLKKITETFGPLTVYSPAKAIVPGYMRSWEQQGKLDIRLPQGVDQDQLLSAIENYKSWADLHQGDIGDMAGFFQSQQGRIPMMDDTNPTQIGHQIRHFGESPKASSVDPLFKAALFLSMAQEYDIHQFGMVRDMDAVHTMEQQMLRQLSGDEQDVDMTLPLTQAPLSSTVHQAVDDPFMTAQRLREWSRLALCDTQAPTLFLTSSKAVVEHIEGFFPDVLGVVDLNLASPGIQETLQALASESDVNTLESASDTHRLLPEHKNQLIFYCLAGVSPFDFLAKLSDQNALGDALVRQGDIPKNTIVGLARG